MCQLVLPAPLSAGEEGAQASQLEPRAPEPRGFPCGAAGKEAACNEGDLGSIPGLGRSPEEGPPDVKNGLIGQDPDAGNH